MLLTASKADSVLESAVNSGEPAHVARYAFQTVMFGVRLATSSVWRTLQQMGWSVQRTGRVWQQNPAGPMRSKQTR